MLWEEEALGWEVREARERRVRLSGMVMMTANLIDVRYSPVAVNQIDGCVSRK